MKTNHERKQMQAYHGDEAVKQIYLGRVRAHRAADELVQSFGYWNEEAHKGCAVGCTIHGSDHGRYETELGVPRLIAKLEDGLFESLPAKLAKTWPERFLEAITPGADLSQVGDRFEHWLLMDEKDGVIRFAKTDEQRKAIVQVGELYAKRLAGEKVERKEWREVWDEAWRVRSAAAADAAAAAAAFAAYAAAYAADAAAAASAAYAADAAASARTSARVRQSEKLLELLRAAPVMAEAA
jgi:hypothetical protein